MEERGLIRTNQVIQAWNHVYVTPTCLPQQKSHYTDKLMSLQMLSQSGPQSSHREFMNLNFHDFYHTQTSKYTEVSGHINEFRH